MRAASLTEGKIGPHWYQLGTRVSNETRFFVPKDKRNEEVMLNAGKGRVGWGSVVKFELIST